MRGWFPPKTLLLLVLFCVTCSAPRPKQYNRASFVVNEPRGFFSQLDSLGLKDNSIWNTKDTYLLSKKGLVATPIESEDEESEVELTRKSSISADKGLFTSDKKVELSKLTSIPNTKCLFSTFTDTNRSSRSINAIQDADYDETGSPVGSGNLIVTNSGDKKEISQEASEGGGYDTGSSEGEIATDDSPTSGRDNIVHVSGSGLERSILTITPKNVSFVNDSVNDNVVLSESISNTNKRQFISRPKFVVRNGYVYMKAPPLTQKTIVTTHIPRPPMVMPYNRFVHSYRGGGEGAYGTRRRSRYMSIPETHYREFDSDDTYDDDHDERHPLMSIVKDLPLVHDLESTETGKVEFRRKHYDDLSHCDGDPCMNGATCNEVRDGYECICPTGFKGTDCEEEDRCHPNPCRNGGVCTEANGQYVCTCTEGFKGVNCQENNHCQPNPCHNAGTCIEVGNEYECTCPVEFLGKDCSEINHCRLTPCLNGGTCSTSYGANSSPVVNCGCLPGYSGSRCEIRDKCHINPCKNGGVCHEGACTCVLGYAGELCEIPPSPCSISTCLNGGTCIAKGLSNYKCICRHGFKGGNCEDESRCEPNPCFNHGVCLDGEDTYKCECGQGYKGSHCEEEVSPCDSNPCVNGGNCLNELNRYKCLCKPGFKGTICHEIDHCHNHFCKNGGTCVNSDEDVRCLCILGYKGLQCEDTDHCTPNPCQNNGVCYENADSYTCQCAGGYRGLHCIDRDPCHMNPCSHQGVCVSTGLDFRCECGLGYSGRTCTIIDKCHPSPCQHGGICISRAAGEYECHCPSGFAGIDCEVEGYPGEIHHYEDHLPVIPIPCRNTHFGCCPDGESAANSPNGGGCPVFFPPT